MANVSSGAIRYALDQATAARESIECLIQMILQQLNDTGSEWHDQRFKQFYGIVMDSVESLAVSCRSLHFIEESLKKLLDTVEKYERQGPAMRTAGVATAAAAGVAMAAGVATVGATAAAGRRPKIQQDKEFSSEKYNEILDQRYKNAVPAAKKVFDLLAEKLCIRDSNYSGPGVSHYSPSDHGVYFNAAEDETNVRGAGTTYYHELGHMVDNVCMRYRNYISENDVFHRALVMDGQRLTQCYDNATPEQRERAVRSLSSGEQHSCSDLANFVTNGYVHGRWGHSEEYCARQWAMEHEAFAHFFEASMGDGTKLRRLTRLFPNAARAFNQMLNAIIKNEEASIRGPRERDRGEER